MQKTNQEKFRIEKCLKEKVINCTSNEKDMIVVVIVRLIKKILREIPSYNNESMHS